MAKHHPHLGSGRRLSLLGVQPNAAPPAAQDTKQTGVTALLALLFVDHGVHLVQTASHLSARARARLHLLAAALSALILATDFTKPLQVNATLSAARGLIGAAYGEISAESVVSVSELASIEAGFVVSAINRATGAQTLRMATISAVPAVRGLPLQSWWDAQAGSAAAGVTAAIRAGALAKTAPDVIAATLNSPSGPIAQATRHADTLTETAVQRIAMDSRHATLKANAPAVGGIQVVATLDSRTCAQCLAYDGATYDMDGNPTGDTALPLNGGPEFHFGCRCSTVPILAGEKPSGGLSAKSWLNSKTAAEKADILGVGRAEIYEKGSMTLSDLVSNTGKQLSLSDLKKKYE